MAVGIPQGSPKKISEFSHLPRPVAARLKIWTKKQRKWPENGHFFSHFFLLAIKFHKMNLFQNRFHRWSTFWAYFPGTSIKVKLTAIIGWAITPIMTIFAIMGLMAYTNYGHSVDLYGCHWKIWPKCRSPVKTVLKKIHPMEFYGQNKKMCEKMAIFRQFPLYFCPNFKRQPPA